MKIFLVLVALLGLALGQKRPEASAARSDKDVLLTLKGAVTNWPEVAQQRGISGWEVWSEPCGDEYWTGVTCYNGKVTKIELPGYLFEGVLPREILSLPYLRVFNLSGNAFGGQLPPQWQSKSLEALDLSNNNLDGPLPEVFGLPETFPRVRVLRLHKNDLKGPFPGAEWTAIGFAKEAQITLLPGNRELCGPVPPIKIDILEDMPSGEMLGGMELLQGPVAYSQDGKAYADAQAYVLHQDLFSYSAGGPTTMVVTNTLGSCAEACGKAAVIRTNLLEAARDNQVTLADLVAQNLDLELERTEPGTQLAIPCYPTNLNNTQSVSSDAAANCFAGGNQRSIYGVVGAELAGGVVNGKGLAAPGPYYTNSVQYTPVENGSTIALPVEPVFWFVKLGAEFRISAVTVTAGDAMQNVRLFIGSNFDNIFGNSYQHPESLNFSPRETRTIVVNPLRPANLVVLYAGRREEGNLSLSRVQVWPSEGNAALWKSVSASDYYPKSPMQQPLNSTVDGSAETCAMLGEWDEDKGYDFGYSSGPRDGDGDVGDGPWMSVDLGMEMDVASVVFTVGDLGRGPILGAQVTVGTQPQPGEISNATLCGEVVPGTWTRRGGVDCGRRGRFVSIRFYGAEQVQMCEFEVFVSEVPYVEAPPKYVSSKATVGIAAGAAATGAAVALAGVGAAMYVRRRRRRKRAEAAKMAGIAAGTAAAEGNFNNSNNNSVGSGSDEEHGMAKRQDSEPHILVKPVQDSFTSTTGMSGFLGALLAGKKWRHRASTDISSGGSGSAGSGSGGHSPSTQAKQSAAAQAAQARAPGSITNQGIATDLSQFTADRCGEVIDFSQIELVRPIGEGSFGLVYLARHLQTTVAVKVLTQDLRGAPHSLLASLSSGNFANPLLKAKPSQEALAALAREACIMAGLRHPCCVRYLGACLDPPALVMEYCSRRSVDYILASANNDPKQASQLDWLRLLSMATDAAKGLLYLHSRNPAIVHRDLKSPNLLVSADWHVKVSDFNVSRVVEEGAALSSLQITNPRWLAPEVLRGEQGLVASDVYAFGIVLWELMTWRLPWGGRDTNPFQIISAVTSGQTLPIPAPDALPAGPLACYDEYVALMKNCWATDPAQRPVTDEVVHRLRAMLTGVVQGRLQAAEKQERELESNASP